MASEAIGPRGIRRLVPAPAHFILPLLVLLATLPLAAIPAVAQDICDNSLETDEGPSPFFGIEYLIMANALAEKACGAPAQSISSIVLDGLAKKQGCGPDTESYAALKQSIEWVAAADLQGLAQDGNVSRNMTPEQVRQWTDTAVDDFGGCPALLDFHAQLHSGDLFGP